MHRSAAAAKGANGVGVRTLLDLAMNWYRNYSPSRCVAGPVVRRGIAEAEPLAVYRSAAAAKGANGVGVRTLLDLAMNW